MANRWGNNENSDILYFWALKSLQMVTAAMKLKYACSLEEVMTSLDSILKSRDIANKGLSSQGYGFSSSHVWSESWAIKKAEHRRIDAFEL